MTVTPEAIIQVVELGVLTGIFMRMGKFGEAIGSLKARLTKLEDAIWKTG